MWNGLRLSVCIDDIEMSYYLYTLFIASWHVKTFICPPAHFQLISTSFFLIYIYPKVSSFLNSLLRSIWQSHASLRAEYLILQWFLLQLSLELSLKTNVAGWSLLLFGKHFFRIELLSSNALKRLERRQANSWYGWPFSRCLPFRIRRAHIRKTHNHGWVTWLYQQNQWWFLREAFCILQWTSLHLEKPLIWICLSEISRGPSCHRDTRSGPQLSLLPKALQSIQLDPYRARRLLNRLK